jgi:acetyl esterase/lipase
MKPLIKVLLGCVLAASLPSCAFKCITRTKDITYSKNDSRSHQLNVFAPRKKSTLNEVLIFVHGGSWNKGKKSLYNFLGSRMSRKGVVVVIPDYPVSPSDTYYGMAIAVSQAVLWVRQNIQQYGGDPDRIYISGHSAGGHLAALVSIRNGYFDTLGTTSPIKGTILIDAAGLDMYGYLSEAKLPSDHTYFNTFTRDPATWKDASPLYHLHNDIPPMLIYRGEKTYPSIIKSHQKFVEALKPFGGAQYQILKGKKHVAMITQFFRTWNPRYDEIIMFMKSD